ncbi:glyoxalase superfamily protein [Priestia taiwanensis]|uniref:Bleomycin resistance protein n=1 Tax=Priestia taiwanensis TaxID=1347902 RepID=A0A917EU33_9BACI|nr:glyoxalase superfamily protein [Priestia taiwanensis]MBM7365053.1 catechol 2,3-dioxygenase-like lactoylglutathione lyase family enzyme [Priestia taiwanensis]GGE83709.1 bleomycin resistance protein [Priestia taiwanensis]
MITPIFRIFDVEKAHLFYVDYLGFQLDWEHQYAENMPFYFQLSFRDMTLHLSEHHGDCSPGSAIRINIRGLKDYHASLSQKEYAYANPNIVKAPWGTIELTVVDPFSNRITFYEEIHEQA